MKKDGVEVGNVICDDEGIVFLVGRYRWNFTPEELLDAAIGAYTKRRA